MSIVVILGEMGDCWGFDLLKIVFDFENSLIRMVVISVLGELGNLEVLFLFVFLV